MEPDTAGPCPACRQMDFGVRLILEGKKEARVQASEASADDSIFPGKSRLVPSSRRETSTSSSHC
jgi:hypothetical protein